MTVENKPIPAPSDEASSDDKLWVLLDYIFTPIIPAIIYLIEDKKSRPFIRAHNAQALAWGLLNVLIGIISSSFLCGVLSLIMWIVGIYWGFKGYQGEYVTIPVITDFVKKQGWA